LDCGKAIKAQRGEREPATAPVQSDENTIQAASRYAGFYQEDAKCDEVSELILYRFAHWLDTGPVLRFTPWKDIFEM
jgi:hypothetical protein